MLCRQKWLHRLWLFGLEPVSSALTTPQADRTAAAGLGVRCVWPLCLRPLPKSRAPLAGAPLPPGRAVLRTSLVREDVILSLLSCRARHFAAGTEHALPGVAERRPRGVPGAPALPAHRVPPAPASAPAHAPAYAPAHLHAVPTRAPARCHHAHAGTTHGAYRGQKREDDRFAGRAGQGADGAPGAARGPRVTGQGSWGAAAGQGPLGPCVPWREGHGPEEGPTQDSHL